MGKTGPVKTIATSYATPTQRPNLSGENSQNAQSGKERKINRANGGAVRFKCRLRKRPYREAPSTQRQESKNETIGGCFVCAARCLSLRRLRPRLRLPPLLWPCAKLWLLPKAAALFSRRLLSPTVLWRRLRPWSSWGSRLIAPGFRVGENADGLQFVGICFFWKRSIRLRSGCD